MDERSNSGMRRRPRVGMGEGSSARGRVGAAGERGQGRNGGGKTIGGLGHGEGIKTERRPMTWQTWKKGGGRAVVPLAQRGATRSRWVGWAKGVSDNEVATM